MDEMTAQSGRSEARRGDAERGYASMSHSTKNLGDEIQTIASDAFLPRIDFRVDRDRLREVSLEKKSVIIMNGWFSHHIERCFPPSPDLLPVFVAFHISRRSRSYLMQPENIQYFRQYAPIGCRDEQTMQWLQEKGVDAFFSKCLTLTFPLRKEIPTSPKVFLVDVQLHAECYIPKGLRQGAIRRTHEVAGTPEEKMQWAADLLDEYRAQAGLIITSRLHCALPCTAMGIPVVMLGDPSDYRLSVAESVGIRIYKDKLLSRSLRPQGGPVRGSIRRMLLWGEKMVLQFRYRILHRSMWNPVVPDMENEKKKLREIVARGLEERIHASQ